VRALSFNFHQFFPHLLPFSALSTASSTAVLVQLTPLLGALVGVIATLILVAICVVIVIKFRSKRGGRRHGNGPDATTTEADKGSAEPLSRNMGSHSSLEDKNPDVVPQEANSEDEFHQEEKAFDRLNMESQRILYTPPTRINTASPPPPSLSPTFGKQVNIYVFPLDFTNDSQAQRYHFAYWEWIGPKVKGRDKGVECCTLFGCGFKRDSNHKRFKVGFWGHGYMCTIKKQSVFCI